MGADQIQSDDEQEDELVVAEKVAGYRYLLPPPSRQMIEKVRGGYPPGDTPGDEEETEPALDPRSFALPQPVYAALDAAAARDKAVGCLLGLAIGDALGAAVEFKPRGSFPPLADMIGGGPFNLKPGEWTDDTTMALCLAESLLATGDVDQDDFMNRLVGWLDRGENTVGGKCFDIGNTTRGAIERFKQTGIAAAGRGGPNSAGNGSLVRLAPLAVFCRSMPEVASLYAQKQCRATHGATECLDGCKLFIEQLTDAVRGADKESVFRQRVIGLSARVLFISAGEYKQKTRDQIKSSGYVVHTLEAALWSVWTTDNFRDAVLTAANLGDDSDSVAAAAGQLAGALYGAAAIPNEWLAKLAWRDKIEELAVKLFERSAG